MQLHSNTGGSSLDTLISSFDDVHTPSNPYCGDVSCWCHNNACYHALVIAPLFSEEVDIEALYSFFGLGVARE